MDTIDVGVVSLAEDHAVERAVKDNAHAHQVLLALDLKVLDLGHVGRLGHLPGVEPA